MTKNPGRIEVQFDAAPLVLAAEGEEGEKRTIAGMAVPWMAPAVTMFGDRVQFAKDSISVQGVPVILHHAPDRPIGVVKGEASTEKGLDASAKISAVRDGDEALVLAGDGVLRGFSVGVNPTEWSFDEESDTLTVLAGDTDHLALVVSPAFQKEQGDLKVAASAASTEGGAVTETAVKTEQSVAEAPAVVAAAPRTPTIQAGLPSAGEWMQAVSEQKRKPEQFAAVQARIQAATGHILDANFDGWEDLPFVGNLIDLHAPASRPLSSALGVRSAPSGVKQFLRPLVNSHLAAATTAAEKSDVTDDGLVADYATVTMSFIKRAANVSAEAQAFSSPDVYGIVARDLVRAYLIGFEQAVVAAMEAPVYTNTVAIAADGSDAVQKLAAGAAAVYGDVFALPDTLVMAPDVWAKFAGFTASDGRSLFPYLGPSNAAGTNTGGVAAWSMNVLGLRPVVVPTLSAGKAYLAVGEYVEVYESSRVNMGPVQEPTVLGTAWGIGGAVGTYITENAVASVTVA